MTLRAYVVAVLAATLLYGCGGQDGSGSDAVYRAIAWLGDDVYAVVDDGSEGNHLARIRDGRELPVSVDPGECGEVMHLYGLSSTGDALVLSAECAAGLRVLRFRPGQPLQVVAAGGGPQIAFEPIDGGVVVASMQAGRCMSLATATGGAQLAPLRTATVVGSSALQIVPGPAPACPGDLEARNPAFTEAGTLVFLAAPGSAQTSGTDRDAGTFGLYQLAAGSSTTSAPVGSLTRPEEPAVLPGGRTVVFTGATPSGPSGIWLINLDNGVMTTVRAGRFIASALSPDGKRLAAIAVTDDDGHRLDTFSLPPS